MVVRPIYGKPIKAPEYSLGKLLQTCIKENTKIESEDRAWVHNKPIGTDVY